jgi:hypothetical protein
LLGKAFEKCHNAGKMSEELYVLYINLLFKVYQLKYPEVCDFFINESLILKYYVSLFYFNFSKI